MFPPFRAKLLLKVLKLTQIEKRILPMLTNFGAKRE
jgi:hypothetical protein